MKLTIITVLSFFAVACGFTPMKSTQGPSSTTPLQAESSRKAFLSAATAAVIGVTAAGPALAMDQELILTPSEQWETGKPTPAAAKARAERFQNARTQMTSNFAPIKRLTVERKSPVVSAR